MSEKKFKESDVVINTQNGKEYYLLLKAVCMMLS